MSSQNPRVPEEPPQLQPVQFALEEAHPDIHPVNHPYSHPWMDGGYGGVVGGEKGEGRELCTTDVEPIVRNLIQWGFFGSRAYVHRYLDAGLPLNFLVETIAEAQAAWELETVKNPGGLVRHLVRQAFPRFEARRGEREEDKRR